MCTHSRFIFNRYSQKRVLVKCGKCPACLQEKACARANRIRNNFSSGSIALFITLTYDNRFIPYVLRNDIKAYGDLNIYRDAIVRYVYNPHSNSTSLKVFDNYESVGSVPLSECCVDNVSNLRPLTHYKDRIGVCWYPDIQNFFKRLRIVLKRHYNYEKYFSYFSCSEYGGHTYRPHFHALLFVPSSDEVIFRDAILEAWPFADKNRTAKFIEIARNAANYVASYVNSNSNFFPLLSCDYFKQKHSQSKNFGVVLECFSLSSILQKIESGNLVYYRQQKFDGNAVTIPMPIPLYVLHRYFPICKGFSWLSERDVLSILRNPSSFGYILNDTQFKLRHEEKLIPVTITNKLCNPYYKFTPRESYQLYVRFENCYQRFFSETGLSRYDYAFYYCRCYDVYKSMILRLSHENVDLVDDYSSFYENAFDVFDSPEIAPTLNPLNLVLDPNKRSDVISKSNHFAFLYDKMNKQRKVTNYVMNKFGLHV